MEWYAFVLAHDWSVSCAVVCMIFVPAGKDPEWTNAVMSTLAAEDVKSLDQLSQTSFDQYDWVAVSIGKRCFARVLAISL